MVEKAQKIAAKAVGQARGAVRGNDWVSDVEASIVANPWLSVILAGTIGFAIAKMGRWR
jgi:hypothetical protein